jgi:hypothetical protein
MSRNNNNYDFGYIQVIQRKYDLRQKSMNRFNNYNNNNKDFDLSDEEMDETIGQ